MGGAVGLALILLVAAFLLATQGETRVAGLEPGELASLTALTSLALIFAGSIVSEFRGRWTQGVAAVAAWLVIGLGVVAAYSYRAELAEVGNRLVGELAPGTTSVGPGGEVEVTRRLGGSFVLSGRANDRPLSFIFDTGASTVVLTAESARALGLAPSDRDYGVPISTANGRTTAAPITLDKLAFGPIEQRRVPALVARPGALRENLLGMTFLDRLASYEVRQNRLILRGRGA